MSLLNETNFFLKKIRIKFIIFCLFFISCNAIKPLKYFHFQNNKIEKFAGIFVKNPTDTIYKKIENLLVSDNEKDTVHDETEIIYKSELMDRYTIFYALGTESINKKNVYLGGEYFISAAFLIEKKSIHLAPITYNTDINWLSIYSFKVKLPSSLNQSSKVKLQGRYNQTILSDFKKEDIIINNRVFSNCLRIKITEIWPETTYTGMVWLSKEYGLLKWIRSTGRIETRIL